MWGSIRDTTGEGRGSSRTSEGGQRSIRDMIREGSGPLGSSQGGTGSIREGKGALWTQEGGQRNSEEVRGRAGEIRGHLNGGQVSCVDTTGMTRENGGLENESKGPLGTRREGQGSSEDISMEDRGHLGTPQGRWEKKRTCSLPMDREAKGRLAHLLDDVLVPQQR